MNDLVDPAGKPIRAKPEKLEQYRKIVKDPWEFLTKCVLTLDQVDKKNPIKKFPEHYDYLKYFVRLWEREPLIIVPKSRRMFMSWCCIGLYTWDTVFSIGRTNIFQSKKEEDSDKLLERAKFILENIPRDVLDPDLIPPWSKTYCKLEVPDLNSEILAFAQGKDQLRSITASGLLFDEFAFWDEAEESWGGAAPTIEGGGRCTIISSAAPGFMEKLVFDQLDNEMEGDEESDEH